jgi:hypothetical protein
MVVCYLYASILYLRYVSMYEMWVDKNGWCFFLASDYLGNLQMILMLTIVYSDVL